MNAPPGAQPITDDLRQWVATQLAAGCRGAEILVAMRASDWTEAVAHQVLREAGANAPEPLPGALPLPGPELACGQTVLDAGGRPVPLLLQMRRPRLLLFGGLLDTDECDALIAEARPRLARSETVADESGVNEIDPARTSEGMFFERGESPLVAGIEARIAALLNWPLAWGEGLQVLRYGPGAEYRPHHDYFDPARPGSEAVLRHGGQRVGTLLLYLNTPARGGATRFPDAQTAVAAVKGNAVFFSYDRPHPSTLTLHGGAPVREGEKWVATKWLREREFG